MRVAFNDIDKTCIDIGIYEAKRLNCQVLYVLNDITETFFSKQI
jgi:hypothetical protein